MKSLCQTFGNQHLRLLLITLILSLASAAASASEPTTLIRNATVLSMDPAYPEPSIGHLLITGSRITAVGPGQYSGAIVPDTIVEAQGKVLMPGFVSGHNHLWQSAFRGLAPNGELYAWLQSLHWTYGKYFRAGDFYAFTLQGALDQLRHGITTTYNHSQRLGADEALYMESLQASLDAGQRFIFAYNPDLSKTESEIRDNFAALVSRASSQPETSMLLGLSVNSVGMYNEDKNKLALEIELARYYKMSLQIHYLEQHSRRTQEQALWPTLKQNGAVADNVSYAHFIHTTDAILKDTAAAGGAMIWNPLSNGRLASGLADIPRYLELGVRVGMGVDGAASADIADPFENMRMGLYALRMQSHSASIMSPREILDLHTLATAEVLGVDDQIGSLAAGKYADLLLINLSQPITGPIFDVEASLVFAASSSNIERIYVGGQLRAEQQQLFGKDAAAINEEVKQRIESLRERAAR